MTSSKPSSSWNLMIERLGCVSGIHGYRWALTSLLDSETRPNPRFIGQWDRLGCPVDYKVDRNGHQSQGLRSRGTRKSAAPPKGPQGLDLGRWAHRSGGYKWFPISSLSVTDLALQRLTFPFPFVHHQSHNMKDI